MTSNAINIIKGRILPKLNDRTSLLHECIKNKRFWVAGGALTQSGTDTDLFCPEPWNISLDKLTVVCKTRNAVTIKLDNNLIQFCNYSAPCLKALLESFDFAHCQIGCEVIPHGTGFDIVDVVWTEDYALSKLLDSSWFTDTKYPLSSLARTGKYYKKGVFTRGTYIRNMIDVLVKFIDRGFYGYQDFLDQLDAVDLGLLIEEMDEVSRANLITLFRKLNKNPELPDPFFRNNLVIQENI